MEEPCGLISIAFAQGKMLEMLTIHKLEVFHIAKHHIRYAIEIHIDNMAEYFKW